MARSPIAVNRWREHMKKYRLRILVGALLTLLASVAAAGAASATPDTSTSITVNGHAIVVHMTGAGVVQPNATLANCSGGTRNWFHMYIVGGGELCLAGPNGVRFTPALPIAGFCGGNNFGGFDGVNSPGHTYHPGTTIYWFPSGQFNLLDAFVTRWTGSNTCPQ